MVEEIIGKRILLDGCSHIDTHAKDNGVIGFEEFEKEVSSCVFKNNTWVCKPSISSTIKIYKEDESIIFENKAKYPCE